MELELEEIDEIEEITVECWLEGFCFECGFRDMCAQR
jgi:hypothetical protein